MRITELLTESTNTSNDFMKILGNFLPVAMEHLQLKTLPKFKLELYIDDDEQPTFGKFVNDENTIYLGIEDRHPLDIIRTLAHELVHFKQGTEHQLDNTAGNTGSPQENQAHELAGIIMRHFNKAHPEYFKESAINISEDWQKVNKHDKTDGMSSKAVKAYRRENPGSKLKTAVTTKPSKLKKGSKSAKRRKSFCARMSGMKKHNAGAKTKRDPNSPINKALRRWNCESIEEMKELIMLGESYVSNLKENFADGKHPERKGLAKRSGVNTKASVSSLRKTAKHSTGEKARMAHWLANMKAGRAKKH
jgi:Zn-dependent peptidase ImmA (M78 family)